MVFVTNYSIINVIDLYYNYNLIGKQLLLLFLVFIFTIKDDTEIEIVGLSNVFPRL